MELEQDLIDATVAVLSDVGLDGLTLERLADKAGISRVTLWRRGVTQERLMEALLENLRVDYREAMWPVLTQPGTGRDRLQRALGALCDVVDKNLTLLLVSDRILHRASEVHTPRAIGFNEAFQRVLRDGRQDGTLTFDASPEDEANVLFNTVCWSYVHLRGRHKWGAARSRPLIFDLVLHGLVAERGRRSAGDGRKARVTAPPAGRTSGTALG